MDSLERSAAADAFTFFRSLITEASQFHSLHQPITDSRQAQLLTGRSTVEVIV